MKKNLLLLILTISCYPLFAQQIDSIFFHLYTDSLKKGQHNYINVDGKLSDGKWLPLSDKEIQFSCATAVFEGNDLILPEHFSGKKVTVTAVLKKNPSLKIEKTIWIKQLPDPVLPTRQDINERDQSKQRNRNRL